MVSPFKDVELLVFVLFFVVLPFVAAIFPVLDMVLKEQLPFMAAWRAKEFWLLWFVYSLLAFFTMLVFHAKNALDYGVVGFGAMLLGFPMFLQSKVISLRDPNTGKETAVGFEYVTKIANQLLVNGLRDSVDEWIASQLEKWLVCDPSKLGGIVKNYLTSKASTDETKQKLPGWVDGLIANARDKPEFKDANLRTLFLEVRKAGGPRAISYVLKRCT